MGLVYALESMCRHILISIGPSMFQENDKREFLKKDDLRMGMVSLFIHTEGKEGTKRRLLELERATQLIYMSFGASIL